jgi:GT2 family glycosyltransferase
MGFGTANNQGMKVAEGEYILLLNSDCFVEMNTIKKMSEPENLDVVGCKLLNQDRSIQQSWGYFPSLRRITQMMLFIDNLPIVRDVIDSIHVRSIKRYQQSHEVDWVTGAFMLMKREVYEKTGGFDEKFFMYGEEIEWQYRIKQQGFKIWFWPEATAVHLIGASSHTRAPAVIGEIEGWKYWFNKYHPGWQETALRLIVFIGCLLRIVLKPQWAKFYKSAISVLSR